MLYTKQSGTAAVPFRWSSDGAVARVFLDDRPDYTLIAPGGVAHRAMEAMRSLLTEAELSGTLLVPSRLWPAVGDGRHDRRDLAPARPSSSRRARQAAPGAPKSPTS